MAVTEAATPGLLNMTRSASVIIEWENALLSELGRTKEMLARLVRQAAEMEPRLAGGLEVLILFDPERVDSGLIEGCLAQTGWRADGRTLRLLPARDLHYYEFKNFGASQASGDLVVFLDSDVIPEDGWLKAMVEPFEDPEIQVIGGNTYLDVESGRFFERAFAAFWFFPLRATESGLAPTDGFFANSLAVRKPLFERIHFPHSETFRGQCHLMGRALSDAGITIYRQRNARASHPPPNGLGHFFVRGICEGYDAYASLYMERKVRAFPLRAFNYFKRMLRGSLHHVRERAGPLQMGFAGTVGAMGVATTYYALGYFGAIASWVAPNWVRRRFAM